MDCFQRSLTYLGKGAFGKDTVKARSASAHYRARTWTTIVRNGDLHEQASLATGTIANNDKFSTNFSHDGRDNKVVGKRDALKKMLASAAMSQSSTAVANEMRMGNRREVVEGKVDGEVD